MERLENKPSKESISITVNDLLDQLAFIAPSINHNDFGKVDPKEIQVNGKYIYRRQGFLAYANGVDWNPNTEGEGFYYWDGAAWVKLAGGGGTPATTVTSEETFGIADAVGTSTNYAREDHTHGSPTNPITAHEAAADPHTGYQKESEKGAASGYASLSASTKVPTAELGGADADSTKFLRGDQTWAVPGGVGGTYLWL